MQLVLKMCDDCKGATTLEHFISDESWQRLLEWFAHAGQPAPALQFLELSWVRWEGSILQRFQMHRSN